MPRRRAIVLVVGGALGALFLYLAVRRLDWQAFADVISRVHPGRFALGLGCLFLYFAVKALRWRYLIEPFARARTPDLLPAVLAGLAGNYVFPHAGEFARAVLAGRRLGAPPGAFLGSIAIERLFDFLALLAIVLAVMLPPGRMSEDVRSACLLIAALCAAILAAAGLFLMRTDASLAVTRALLAPFSRGLADRAVHHLRQARVGLGAIATPRLLLPVFALSLLQWLVFLGCIAFSMAAVDVLVTPASAVVVLLLNVIGLTLPAAPAHVGTVQIAFIVALAPFGVAREHAFAASVVYNFLIVVPTVILGFAGLRQAAAGQRNRMPPG